MGPELTQSGFSTESKLVIKPFDGTNFSVWKIRIKSILRAQNLYRCVTGPSRPRTNPRTDRNTLQLKEGKILA